MNEEKYSLASHTLALARPIDMYIDIRYTPSVIRNLVGKTTQDIYNGVNSRQARKVPSEVHERTRRLMDQLNAAPSLDFLKIPPSNRLEKLRGNLRDFWSLRINNQWRLIFRWEGNDALDVEICDFHR